MSYSGTFIRRRCIQLTEWQLLVIYGKQDPRMNALYISAGEYGLISKRKNSQTGKGTLEE